MRQSNLLDLQSHIGSEVIHVKDQFNAFENNMASIFKLLRIVLLYMESDLSHYAKIIGQINSTCAQNNYNFSSSSSGMSSNCKVVQKELKDHTSMLSSQIESCQQVLSLNTSQLENQNAVINSLKTANQQLLSQISILEADLFAQEAKSSEIEQQNAKLSQIEDTLSKLLKKMLLIQLF